jgi:hypothetical protein
MSIIELEMIVDHDRIIHRRTLREATQLLEYVRYKLSYPSETVDLVLHGESRLTGKKDWFTHRLTRDQAEWFANHLESQLSAPLSHSGSVLAGLKVFEH